jgi:hypothetical protein
MLFNAASAAVALQRPLESGHNRHRVLATMTLIALSVAAISVTKFLTRSPGEPIWPAE